ncbi:hypothetical protein GGI21_005441, partial [Coemansia aciculifera]
MERLADSRGDVRATQVALLGKALNHGGAGVVLNLLLDWNTGAALVSDQFLDRVCERFLSHPQQIRASLEAGRQLLHMVGGSKSNSRSTTATGFVDALWAADNFECALAGLSALAAARGEENADSLVPPYVVAALATQLMQCALMAGRHHIVERVFVDYEAWLRRSLVAHNILLHPHAQAFDMAGVVKVLMRMRAHGVDPDSVTWSTIVAGMCASGRLEQALKLFALHLGECPGFLPQPPNLWQRWQAQTTRAFMIHPYFVNVLREMAARNRRTGVAWTPTLAVHKLLLKHLGRRGRLREVAEYYALLKQSWPKEHAAAAGLRGIERMVRALLAQDKTELRLVLGLNVGETPLDPDESPHFYDHCARIQALAS